MKNKSLLRRKLESKRNNLYKLISMIPEISIEFKIKLMIKHIKEILKQNN